MEIELPVANSRTMNEVLRFAVYILGSLTFAFIGSAYNRFDKSIDALQEQSSRMDKDVIQCKSDITNHVANEKNTLQAHNLQFESFKSESLRRMAEDHDYVLRIDSRLLDMANKVNSLNEKLLEVKSKK